MSIVERIDNDIKQALKGGEKDKLTALRGFKSALKYRQIEAGKELSDQEVIEVLASQAKKLRESIEQYRQAGRDDLVAKEQAELELVSAYLPKQLSEDELAGIIREAIAETGADSPQKIGLVMKAVMPKVKGRADGKLVNRLVSEILAK
ncbi:MAG: GatB/YqeY domain-containing protein [Candidatus Zixiibacteriota bacterium]|nr:MAG: GatB/YqeY domain-containing protein [candidate division Zixibacteria bacterium]